MEALLKEALNTSLLKRTGKTGSGCINEGEAYHTDHGTVFVKINGKDKAKLMFDGEFAGLEAMQATNTVKVPKPLAVIERPKGCGAALAMEYLDLRGLRKYTKQLGEQLARMHLYNEELGKKEKRESSRVHGNEDEPKYVEKYGFHITTCCGYIAMDNTWHEDWPTFFSRCRLQSQINMLMEKRGDRELSELWSKLQLIISDLFKDVVGDIRPALVHGDLWGGNVGEIETGPVIYDPATFYAHHEFEFGIATMFGGFGGEFFKSYHSVIPEAPGFHNRLKLYQLFHYLNHWNHFGSGYRGSSISTMRSLLK